MDERESVEKRRKERKAAMDTVMEFMITAYIDGVATYEEVEIMANIWRDTMDE
ncbi:MAG: hypothetical protein [Caudoviricetes sp.]|nr:MAG: hypothetical protein [Caudoviricetes sp.]